MTPALTWPRRRLLQAGAAASVLPAGPAHAAQSIKLSLDFYPNGSDCAFLYAEDRGFFREEGVDVTIDKSAGSGDAIVRVASGAYDFGYADMGALVEFAARNPQTMQSDAAPKMVMTVHDRPPHCVISFKKAGIAALPDLVGRKLGTGSADATARLLTALLRINGVDLAKIDRQIIDIRLRDSLLMRGAVDAVAAYDYTVIFNLMGNGIQPSALRLIMFAENGFDFYGNGLVTSRALIQRDPGLVRRVARACARGWVAASHDPAGATQSLVRRDPLIDGAIEAQRLAYAIKHNVLTDRVREGGMGQFDPARAERGIAVIAEGFDLPRQPSPDEIYDGRFLPPLADRSGFAIE